MSFQNKNIWMPRDQVCLPNGEMGYDTSSRVEPKRARQWFMDTSEPDELFCNKKQAREAVNNRPTSAISNANVSLWDNASDSQSVSAQVTDRPFGLEPVRSFNLGGRNNNPSVGSGNLNLESKGFAQFAGSGSRGGKVNQVTDVDNEMSASLGHSYRGDNNMSLMGTTYNKINNSISLGSTYRNREESTISVGPNFGKTDDNLTPVGSTLNKGDGHFMWTGHNYNKVDNSMVSRGQPFDKVDGSFISIGNRYEKGDEGNDNFISMGSNYNKANENFISMGPSYEKGDDNIISMGTNHKKANTSIASINTAYSQGDSSILSMGQNYSKGESNTISFGSFEDISETDPSGRIITGYDLLMGPPSGQASNVPVQEDSAECIADPVVSIVPAATSRSDIKPKNKEQKVAKKLPPNNFPSNVKSLLSTGILDGVPVKYISSSRKKNLAGIIEGTGYLCGCDKCKLSKAVNAYEFEHHAVGFKTKHPNNHIYFGNGKTIYAVAQELKSTPQEILFEVIQNVTGSPINQKNFTIWKGSYEAASRELQRIYGKEEMTMPS